MRAFFRGNRMRWPACLGALVAHFIVAAAWASEPALVVNLVGVRNAAGTLRVGVYAEGASYGKENRTVAGQLVAARPGTVQVVFADLPPGRYAVMAYHDEDANGELNRRFGMFPSEGYGLSNNPRVIGRPAFADSAFDLVAGQPLALRIDVRY